MKILKCDLCNSMKEIPASNNDKTDFFIADIKEYDGCEISSNVTSQAHICPECFSKIKSKVQTEEQTTTI